MLWSVRACKPAMYVVMLETPVHEARKLDLENTHLCSCPRPSSQTELTRNNRGLNHVHNLSESMQHICQGLGMTLDFTIVEEPNFSPGQSLHACIIGPLPDENTADYVLRLEYFACGLPQQFHQLRLIAHGLRIPSGHRVFSDMIPSSTIDDYGNVYHVYLNDDLTVDGKYYRQHLPGNKLTAVNENSEPSSRKTSPFEQSEKQHENR